MDRPRRMEGHWQMCVQLFAPTFFRSFIHLEFLEITFSFIRARSTHWFKTMIIIWTLSQCLHLHHFWCFIRSRHAKCNTSQCHSPRSCTKSDLQRCVPTQKQCLCTMVIKDFAESSCGVELRNRWMIQVVLRSSSRLPLITFLWVCSDTQVRLQCHKGGHGAFPYS